MEIVGRIESMKIDPTFLNRIKDELGVTLTKAQEIKVMSEFQSTLVRELDGIMEKAIERVIFKEKLANADGFFEKWETVIKNMEL